MRRYLPAALLAVLALFLAPPPVHAQYEGGGGNEGDCEDGYTWADSYLYADSSGNLNGYSTTYNECVDPDISVGVSATIYDSLGNVVASGQDWEYFTSNDATVDLYGTATTAGWYELAGDHYMCYYDVFWVEADSVPYTWASAYSPGAYAPAVTSVSESGSPLRGGSGSATIAGTNLAICGYTPMVSIDSVTASVTSEECIDPEDLGSNDPTQIVVSYSIPSSTTSGSHQITITTIYGTGYGTFTVDDPTPSISSVGPSTWTAGGEQYFTISGSYFGAGPSINITGDAGTNIGSYGISSSSDTSISAFVDLTYSSGGSATVTVQSFGDGGNGFMEGSGGGSQTSPSESATITAPARPTVAIQVESAKQGGGNNAFVLTGTDQSTTNVTATGSPSGGTYSWVIGPRLAFQGPSTQQNATITGTSASTSQNDTWVQVGYTVNGASGSASIRATVRVPSVMVALNYPGGANFTTVVSGTSSGYLTNISYYIYDQDDLGNQTIAVAGINATEVLRTVSNPFNAAFIPHDNTPYSDITNSTGQVWDLLSATLQGGLPQGFSASRTQSWTVSGYSFSPDNTQTYGPTYATISNYTCSQ